MIPSLQKKHDSLLSPGDRECSKPQREEFGAGPEESRTTRRWATSLPGQAQPRRGPREPQGAVVPSLRQPARCPGKVIPARRGDCPVAPRGLSVPKTYIHMCARAHAHVHTHTCTVTHMLIYTCVHMPVHMCRVHIHICSCVHVHMCVHMLMHTYAQTCTLMATHARVHNSCSHMHNHMHAGARACMRVCTYTHKHAQTHTHTHTSQPRRSRNLKTKR